MRTFPYRFQSSSDAGPALLGLPVVYSPHLATVDGSRSMIVASDERGRPSIVLSNDPDFAWNLYRAECRDQARRIVRDGLAARLPWLRILEAA